MHNKLEPFPIRGILLVDGQPLPNQEILIVSEQMDKFLGTCLTDAAGQFSSILPIEDRPERVILLAQVKSNLVTVSYKLIQLPQTHPIEIYIDAKDQVFKLDGEIESAVGWPNYLNIFLDPVQIQGIPEGLEQFFSQKDQGVFDVHFREISVHTRTFSFKVKAGKYRIGGQYINYDRPMLINPDFDNYIIDKAAFASNKLSPLTGSPESGFLLEVDTDCQVVCSLRIVEDEEL
jgi:hypothetical protein